MNSLLTLFSAKFKTHQNRSYVYFDKKELNIETASNLKSNDTCLFINHLSALKISGSDAKKFLQGQLTIDIETSPCPPIGLYLSRKGRIISLFYFTQHQDDYYLFMPQDIMQVFVKQLKKYIFTAKVTLTIYDEYIVALSETLFNKFNNNLLSNSPIIKTNHQYLCFLNETQMKQLHQSYLIKKFDLLGDWAWHKSQLLAKIPSIYPATIAKFLVHDLQLHLKNTVDFKKGCYIGQEIVARMHYKAKLNHQLTITHTTSASNIEPGNELIIDGIKQGVIIDGLTDLNNNHIFLVCSKKQKTNP